MKDLLITAEQLQQLFAFLQEQPHKFSAPMIGFFSQLMNEQEEKEKAKADEAPLASKKVK